MHFRFFVCFLLFCNLNLFAQVLTVRDSKSNVPVELVTLSNGNNVYTTTNTMGQADISKFKNAESIEIRSLGYKTLVKSYADLQVANFQLVLEPTDLDLDEVVVSATK